jgi:hypothetical protein
MDNSAARSKIEQSLAANPKNAHGAQGFAHVGYESGEVDAARSFLSSWLTTYPCEGFFYGHRSWHLSLCEIQAGNWSQAFRLYQDAVALDQHSGGPQLKMSDGHRFCGASNSPGARATPRTGADYTGTRTARCPDRATGSPICMSCWRRPS